MIRGIDLFGREAISPNEKKILKSANKTAHVLFSWRFSPLLQEELDKEANDVTLEDVEKIVIIAIKKANGDKRYGAKTVC